MIELEKAAVEAFKKLGSTSYLEIFKAGANWQYEQFEKERLNFEPRLKHCDELTAEQAQIESDFVVQHLKKCNRTPTFIDAIEFGAEWGKNQAMVEIQAQSMALAHGCPEESESEDLEGACEQLAENARKHKAETSSPFFCQTDYKQGVIDGAKWQKEQMMSKAIRGRVSVNVESNYHSLIYGCWDMDNALINYNEGDKVKVIVIKEE